MSKASKEEEEASKSKTTKAEEDHDDDDDENGTNDQSTSRVHYVYKGGDAPLDEYNDPEGPAEGVPEDVVHLVIDQTVTRIGKNAFYKCRKLKSVEFQKNKDNKSAVEEIDNYAFAFCSSLERIDLPRDSLKKIGFQAFWGCDCLLHIDIPETVSFMNNYIFEGCSSLKTVQIPPLTKVIPVSMFYGCSSLASFQIPTSVTKIEAGAFGSCLSLKTIDIPNSVKVISDGAFKECGFEDLSHLPDSVISIENYAFARCAELSKIHIPSSINKLAEGVFAECSSLKNVQIPLSVTSIEEVAFRSCSSISSIIIPPAVTSIGVQAFEACTSLVSMYIPSNVTTIGEEAFRNCSSLTIVHIPESVESIGKDAFYGSPFYSRLASLKKEELSLKKEEKNAINDDNVEKNDALLDLRKNFPLHTLCNRSKETLSVQDIQDYLVRDSNSCIEMDALGRTPLHVLAMNPNITNEVLDCFLMYSGDKRDAVANEKDFNGLLPLHYLCTNPGATADVVHKLIDVSVLALSTFADGAGVPLKLALWSNLSDEVTKLLFACHPIASSSVLTKDTSKIKSIAEQYLEDLQSNPPKSPVNFGVTKQHGWVTFVSNQDVLNISSPKLEDDCIAFIQNCEESAAKLLAKAKNISGSSAFGIAVPRIQNALRERLLFLGRYELVLEPPIHKSATCVVVKGYDENRKHDYNAIFDKFVANRTEKSLTKSDLKALFKEFGMVTFSDALIDEFYDKYDYDGGTGIGRDEFFTLCQFEFDKGQRHQVAFKFMKDEQQFQREKNSRSNLSSEYVVSVIDSFPKREEDKENGSKIIVDSVPNDTKNEDENNSVVISSALKDVLLDYKAYKHALLMPYADRDLHAVFLSERPDVGRVRDYTKQIAEALKHLHDEGIIHGDLKLLNIVRLGGRMVLIDLDASVKMNAYAGCKFSSGVVPPEMIHCIDNEDDFNKFNNYFQNEKKSDGILDDDIQSKWEKIQPRMVNGVGAYVVKTFYTTTVVEKTFMGEIQVEKPVDADQLPYKLVEASPAYDAWSLGTILFTLLKGKPLFPVNRDDDLDGGRAMQELCDWDDGMLAKKLKEGASIPAQAKDLLQKLLQPDPSKRCTMEDVLAHGFFHHVDAGLAESLNQLDRKMSTGFEQVLQGQKIIMNMNRSLQEELSRTRSILLYGMFEATEVQTPTAFVITKTKISKPAKASSAKDDFKLEDLLDKNGKGFKPDAMLSEDQQKTLKKVRKHFEEAKLWTSRVAKICTGVLDGNIGDIFGTVKEGLGDLVTNEKMYFYFIDELTGEPVLGNGYPKEITTPSELVPKLLPLMQVSMRAVSLVNGAAGVARMFGFPLPQIPEEVRENMQSSVNILKQESSVAKFGSIHNMVKDLTKDSGETEAKENVRGESLRQLLKFLDKEVQEKNFAGLNRYPDPRSGKAIWTALKTPEEVEKAIEKLSQDFKEEEHMSSKSELEALALQQKIEKMDEQNRMLRWAITNGRGTPGQVSQDEDDSVISSVLSEELSQASETVDELRCKAEEKREAFIQEFKKIKRKIYEKETSEELTQVLSILEEEGELSASQRTQEEPRKLLSKYVDPPYVRQQDVKSQNVPSTKESNNIKKEISNVNQNQKQKKVAQGCGCVVL